MAASWQMRGVALFTRLVYRRRFVTEEAGRRTLARAKGPSAPPSRLGLPHDVRTIGGFPVHHVGTPSDRPAVVYLHGGAYTSEIVKQHWALVADIVRHTGCDVHVPIYGLSPEHDGLEALAFVTAVVRELTGQGRRCYLAGDSSGGGLALLTAQALPGLVAGLTVIAPWLDLTMSNPGVDEVEPHDPWLFRAGLRPLAAAWAGDLPLDDPRVSPIFGDLEHLPPTQVLVGTRDITLPDCRLLRDRVPPATKLTYHEQEGAIHAYPLLPVPEARRGRQAIYDHIELIRRT
ncbi:esterase [Paractinoplanes deccanensis]|uniref:Esterase n=1 Tax=Paractinoplanes deccanensis TaxID=113561 RepID=A0ABQ3XWZ9_9ACTN|nr:alpha/beta hydrolase [Actinoplanes deccanensis]GID72283.1 esterase [Actinoplanes deccanensis]